MPPGREAHAPRPPWRAWLAIPLGAVFIGSALVPALPASAEATLDLDLAHHTADPGASFSLPLSVRNTLDSVEVTVTGVTATAGSSAVVELDVADLPEVLEPGSTTEAEVVGSVAEDAPDSRVRVEVEIAYSYETPCDPPESSAPPASSVPEDSAPPAPENSEDSGPTGSPEASPNGGDCPDIEGTARVSASITVVRPSVTPTGTPDPGQTSPTPTTSAPPEQPPATRSPEPARSSPPPPARPSSPTRPPAPHSPVSTVAPGAPSGDPPRDPLPTGAADLPELSAPTDEYADLPMVTPGEASPEDGAATVGREEDRVDPLVTPFVLLLVLMLLLLLATPLGPARRVRVRQTYVGRRRRH